MFVLVSPVGSLILAAAVAAAVPPADEKKADEKKDRSAASFEWPDLDAELRLTGLAQWDGRGYPGWQVDDELRHERSDLPRRLRLGLEGRWKQLYLEVDADTEEGPDHDPERGHLRDLFAELRVSKAVRVRAGHFKLPVSAERLTPAARLDFIERTRLASDLAPERDFGLMTHGAPAKRLEYAIGVFKGDDRSSRSRAGTTVAARVVASPRKSIDVGASFSQGRVEAAPMVLDADPDPDAYGIAGNAASGFRFFPRQFVNGQRRRLGLEGAYTTGPLSLRAEALRLMEERLGQGPICTPAADALACDDLPSLRALGWSASVTWLVTGEKKTRSVKPRQPLFDGGWGALEVGLRVEQVRFDDAGPEAGFPGASNRARNIARTGEDALTAGLSWWPHSWARLMANVVVERFEDPLLAPETDRRGNYVTLLLRLQLQVP